MSLIAKRGLPTLVVVILTLLYVYVLLAKSDGNPRKFVVYDGHYAYQMAYRIFDEADQIPDDYPYRDEFPSAYRWQRILYPLLSRLLAVNRPELIPWTLILINIVAIGAGTWITELILEHYGESNWYALAYGLYGGQFVALLADMHEPLSQALVQLAILAWLKNRQPLMVVAFALAILAKETALLFAAAFIIYYLIGRHWRQAIYVGLSIGPYFILQLFFRLWMDETAFSPVDPFILFPFGGWLMIARIDLLTFVLISLMIVPIAVIPTIAGLIISVRSFWYRYYDPYAISIFLNSLFILILPHLTFRESSATIRVVQGLSVSILLYGASVHSKRILNYSMLWIFSNVILVGTIFGGN